MSRITVIKDGKRFRCGPETARAYIARGAKLDEQDARGVESYHAYMLNRTPPVIKKAPKRATEKES